MPFNASIYVFGALAFVVVVTLYSPGSVCHQCMRRQLLLLYAVLVIYSTISFFACCYVFYVVDANVNLHINAFRLEFLVVKTTVESINIKAR